jgi:hypothetical protein
MNEFIQSVEDIWLNFTVDSNEISNPMNDQELINKYDSLKEHADLIKKIFGYYHTKNSAQFNHEKLLVYLNDLFRNVFTIHDDHINSNIDKDLSLSEMYVLNKKNRLLLLFAWTSLLMDTFQAETKSSAMFKLNSINLLQMINLHLSPRSTRNNVNYLYFIQNDRHLCIEYLVLINSFEILTLNLAVNNETADDPMTKINKFVENVIFDTILILVNSVAFKQLLFPTKQQQTIQQNEGFIINNLVNIVPFIQSSLNKSSNLFEQGLKYLVSILAKNSSFGENNTLNASAAELFKCFEIKQASLMIKNFLYVIINYIHIIYVSEQTIKIFEYLFY